MGFPLINQKKAEKILSQVPTENVFFFYEEMNQPLGVSLNSLSNLCDKNQPIDIKSIEFHTAQGHMEPWIAFLGDLELSKRLTIKDANLKGEMLREILYKTFKFRLKELQKIGSQ